MCSRKLTRLPFLATIVVVLLIRVVFVVTFPLNNEGGDTANYYMMIRTWTSSLVHAGGHPFLLGWPFTIDAIGGQVVHDPIRFAWIVLVMQHAIDFGLVLFFATVCLRVFGQAVACMFLVLYVLHPLGLGPVSSVYPEWLQAALFVAAIGLGLLAVRDARASRKLLLYTTSAALLGLCCLTKFNAAFALPPFFVAAVLAEKKQGLRRLAIGIGASTVTIASIVLLYEIAFHVPSTGSWRLSYDGSWLLMAKISDVFGGNLPTDSGIESRRWMVLARTLPQNYLVAGPQMFSHVNAVPDEIRAKYRPVFERVIRATDPQLEELQRVYPLPSGFRLQGSSVPVSYYVGLKESEELGMKVFLEVLRTHPNAFIHYSWTQLSTCLNNAADPLVPTTDIGQYGFKIAGRLSSGFVLLEPPSIAAPSIPYAYSRPILWWPGVVAFGWLRSLMVVPVLLLALFAACALFTPSRQERVVVLVIASATVTFVAGSSVIYQVRWKELRFLWPFAVTLFSIGIANFSRIAWSSIDRFRQHTHMA